MSSFTDEWQIVLTPNPPGGQVAGTRPQDWLVVHIPTGISIKVPADMTARSQFKTRNAILSCIELLVEDLYKNQ